MSVDTARKSACATMQQTWRTNSCDALLRAAPACPYRIGIKLKHQLQTELKLAVGNRGRPNNAGIRRPDGATR